MSSPSENPPPKLLEGNLRSTLMLPLAIFLVGGLVYFGVTKMISTERSYKDLVRELNSKTFGNRWIAAYELSKVLGSKSVPDKDMPWLIANLEELYGTSQDSRSRDFLVVAVGSLKKPESVPLLLKALNDSDKNVVFHALVALGNLPGTVEFSKEVLLPFLAAKDHAHQQAAILALATHRYPRANGEIQKLLAEEAAGIRYAAATSLINYKNSAALPVLKEILLLDGAPIKGAVFDANQVRSLKLNVLYALRNNKWSELNAFLGQIIINEKNPEVAIKAKEALILLKK
jgi:HEAT repeat protein